MRLRLAVTQYDKKQESRPTGKNSRRHGKTHSTEVGMAYMKELGMGNNAYEIVPVA